MQGLAPELQAGARSYRHQSYSFLLVIIPYWTVVFAMGTKSAKAYFNLACPSCGQFRGRAADFFFKRAKCGPCKTEF